MFKELFCGPKLFNRELLENKSLRECFLILRDVTIDRGGLVIMIEKIINEIEILQKASKNECT